MRANRSSFTGTLACQGAMVGTIRLASGEIITDATTVDDFSLITRNTFKRSDPGDMQLVILVMRMLFMRDVRYAPPNMGGGAAPTPFSTATPLPTPSLPPTPPPVCPGGGFPPLCVPFP